MNTFMNNMTATSNYNRTANGALAYKSTLNPVFDLFALGGAYRNRSNEDCIFLFKKAFDCDETYALKCLFYLRDVRGGQGERRFFRICMKWLANSNSDGARRNLKFIPMFGRWDDLYIFVDTPLENDALQILRDQLELDVQCKTPSLMAKWLKSENTSSKESRKLGKITRKYLGMTPKQYRKTLSVLRERINVLERLMSAGEWDKIEFDKIPSKAGIKYKNAFARHDIEREQAKAQTYADFAKSDAKVNAKDLYPYEIVDKALKNYDGYGSTDRLMLDKFWDNQKDYLKGKPCKMMCVCDTSGSMRGRSASAPINMAIGLSMYCAERQGGPFKDHYISFSSRPQFIKIEGIDFTDKVKRIYRTNLCDNTNIEATFKLLKKQFHASRPEDCPDTLVIISDMQIDCMTGPSWFGGYSSGKNWNQDNAATEMEKIRAEWAAEGLECPRLVYWNVNASKDTILDLGPNVSFVSGASPSTFEQVLTGKTGINLMLEVLDKERYNCIF